MHAMRKPPVVTISIADNNIYFWRGVSYRIAEGDLIGYHISAFRFYETPTPGLRKAVCDCAARSSYTFDPA